MPSTAHARVIVSVPPPAAGVGTPQSLDRRIRGLIATVASLEAVEHVGMLHLGLQAVRRDLAEIRRELRKGEGV